jgi:hypothetical protein
MYLTVRPSRRLVSLQAATAGKAASEATPTASTKARTTVASPMPETCVGVQTASTRNMMASSQPSPALISTATGGRSDPRPPPTAPWAGRGEPPAVSSIRLERTCRRNLAENHQDAAVMANAIAEYPMSPRMAKTIVETGPTTLARSAPPTSSLIPYSRSIDQPLCMREVVTASTVLTYVMKRAPTTSLSCCGPTSARRTSSLR